MDIEHRREEIDHQHPEANKSLDCQDAFTPENEERILEAVKNLDEGKKVYHDLIEIN